MIERYIFPGCLIPRWRRSSPRPALVPPRHLRLDEIGEPCAAALRRWRANIRELLDDARALGLDRRSRGPGTSTSPSARAASGASASRRAAPAGARGRPPDSTTLELWRSAGRRRPRSWPCLPLAAATGARRRSTPAGEARWCARRALPCAPGRHRSCSASRALPLALGGGRMALLVRERLGAGRGHALPGAARAVACAGREPRVLAVFFQAPALLVALLSVPALLASGNRPARSGRAGGRAHTVAVTVMREAVADRQLAGFRVSRQQLRDDGARALALFAPSPTTSSSR